MIYQHYDDFDAEWKWDNFSPEELSCNHCGQYYHDPYSLDLIQAARNNIKKPFHINSAHRCNAHNAAVGGRPASKHLKIAFDIRVNGLDPNELYSKLDRLYPTTCGIGVYSWGVHIDFRKNKARW